MNLEQWTPWPQEKSLPAIIPSLPIALRTDSQLSATVLKGRTAETLTRQEVHHQTCCDWAMPPHMD